MVHNRRYKYRGLGIGDWQAVDSTIVRIEKGEIIFLPYWLCRDPMQEVCPLWELFDVETYIGLYPVIQNSLAVFVRPRGKYKPCPTWNGLG